MKQRNDTRSKLSRDRFNITLQQQYTDEKKVVKSRIAASIKDYYVNKFNYSKGNSSAIWNLIKELVPNKNYESHVHKFENVINKADEFNTFANVGKKTYDRTQQTLHDSNSYSSDRLTTESSYGGMKFRPHSVEINTNTYSKKF